MREAEMMFERLRNVVNLNFLSQQEQEDIRAYLEGEKQTIILPEKNIKLSYSLCYDLATQMKAKGEAGEVAKRALYICSILSPKQVMSQFMYWDNRYDIYSEIGLDQHIVIEDIKRAARSFCDCQPYYVMKNLQERLERYNSKPAESRLGNLFDKYGEAIQITLEELEARHTDIEICIVLRGMIVILMHQPTPLQLGAMTKEEAIADLERILLNAMPRLYLKEEVEAAYETYFGKNLLGELIQYRETVNQQAMKVLRSRAIFVMAYMCREYSPVIRNILKLHMALIGGIESEEYLKGISFNDSYILLDDLMKELEMQARFRLEFYSRKCMMDYFEENALWYADKLREIYEDDKEIFVHTYKALLEDYDKGAITLYVMLKRCGAEVAKEDVLELEKIAEHIKAERRNSYARRWNQEQEQSKILLFEVSSKIREKVLENMKSEPDYITKFAAARKAFYKDIPDDVLTYLSDSLGAGEVIAASIENNKGLDNAYLIDFVKAHIKVANEVVLEKIKEGKENILDYVRLLYKEEIGMDYGVLVQIMNHRLKTVINFLEEFFKDKEALVRPHFGLVAKVKNKNMQEAITRLEKKWDQNKLTAAIKSKENIEEVAQYINSIYKKANEKYIPFNEEINWTGVHDKKGNVVPEIVLKYYVSEYMLLKEIYIIEACELIKDFINQKELTQLITDIYKLWLEKEADTKQKNIVLLYALNATGENITVLKKQIDTWTENSRGALAAFSVTAMAMNGSSLALMYTDSIAQKYKNKQVRGAAQAAIEYVAEVRGVSKDTLGDKIVPSLGFDQRREMALDYGSRSFKCILTPELDIVIFDQSGKKIKSLPKANAQDDVELVDAAKQQLKGLKKQMKAVIKMQTTRLEKAMLTGRSWTQEGWQELFVNNPIMNGFAMSLIWAERNPEGEILGTFRYMEDGTFNTVDEEEYSFQEGSNITLLHPIDTDAETVQAWKEQLEDYEIKQAIMQLDMPIYSLEDEDVKDKVITRFCSKKVYFGTVMGVMDKYDWRKTVIGDGGGYLGYYYEDATTGVGIQLTLDFVYVGMTATEEIKMEEVRFYDANAVDSTWDDEIKEANMIAPKDVPAKVLNFALMIGESIAAKEI